MRSGWPQDCRARGCRQRHPSLASATDGEETRRGALRSHVGVLGRIGTLQAERTATFTDQAREVRQTDGDIAGAPQVLDAGACVGSWLARRSAVCPPLERHGARSPRPPSNAPLAQLPRHPPAGLTNHAGRTWREQPAQEHERAPGFCPGDSGGLARGAGSTPCRGERGTCRPSNHSLQRI